VYDLNGQGWGYSIQLRGYEIIIYLPLNILSYISQSMHYWFRNRVLVLI
jgi:hypothetical protein